MHPNFEEWIHKNVPKKSTARTKISKLRSIESEYGDLDELYDDDELEGLILELTYTADDARSDRPDPSRLKIKGELSSNLASYKAAVKKYALFRRAGESDPSLVYPKEDVDAGNAITFSLEQDMQQALRQNIEQLETGLTITDGGTEYSVPAGRIDILGRDASGRAVIVELKAVTAKREVLGQIVSYMSDVQERESEQVRGFLVAPDFDPKLISAARLIPGLSLIRYSIRFDFVPVDRAEKPENEN